MPTITEIISAYYQAVEAGESLSTMTLLASLEDDCYCNETDWETSYEFLKKHKLDARLEIVTKLLIKRNKSISAKPFRVLATLLIKSDRLAEAMPLLDEYRKRKGDLGSDKWEFVNLLYDLRLYRQCLDEVGTVLIDDPNNVPCLVMQAKALWRLKEYKAVRKKLKDMIAILEDNAGNWIWYISAALEFNEFDIAQQAGAILINKIESDAMRLSQGLVSAAINAGFENEIREIVVAAKPGPSCTLSELLEMFEIAIRFGAAKAALRFGEAIIAVDPGHQIAGKLKAISDGNGFLLA